MLSHFHWQDFRQLVPDAQLHPIFGFPGTSAGKAKVPGNFSTHSFRTGTATVAARNGVPDHLIQNLWAAGPAIIISFTLRHQLKRYLLFPKSWADEVLRVPAVPS